MFFGGTKKKKLGYGFNDLHGKPRPGRTKDAPEITAPTRATKIRGARVAATAKAPASPLATAGAPKQ